jgi:hypothetical protein
MASKKYPKAPTGKNPNKEKREPPRKEGMEGGRGGNAERRC